MQTRRRLGMRAWQCSPRDHDARDREDQHDQNQEDRKEQRQRTPLSLRTARHFVQDRLPEAPVFRLVEKIVQLVVVQIFQQIIVFAVRHDSRLSKAHAAVSAGDCIGVQSTRISHHPNMELLMSLDNCM